MVTLVQNLGQNIVSDMGENIFLYQLAFLRSTESLLKRIPSGLGGVYAWYRHFNITQALSDDSSLFFKFMLSELSKDHCVSRSSKILPAYKISLCSDNGSFPKLKLLEKLSEEKEFRDSILEILNRKNLVRENIVFCVRILGNLMYRSNSVVDVKFLIIVLKTQSIY